MPSGSSIRTRKEGTYYAANRERISVKKKARLRRRTPEEIEKRKRYMKAYRLTKEYRGKRRLYRLRRSQTLYSILSCVRQRAKARNIPYNLTIADIRVPEFCPVLGLKMARNEGRHGPCDTSPSVDKLIPGLGYVSGNVRIISNRANRLKGDSTDPLEMIAIADDMASRLSLQQLVEMARL